jgi:hypothetical protein
VRGETMPKQGPEPIRVLGYGTNSVEFFLGNVRHYAHTDGSLTAFDSNNNETPPVSGARRVASKLLADKAKARAQAQPKATRAMRGPGVDY